MGLDITTNQFLKTILKYIKKNFNEIKWQRFTIINTKNYIKVYFYNIKTFFIFQKFLTPNTYKLIKYEDYKFYFYD